MQSINSQKETKFNKFDLKKSKKRKKKKKKQHKGKDREFETALQNNTIALVELRATLTSLSEKISDLSHRVRLLETEN